MADTVVSDGLKHPQDEGLPNISDGNEDWQSAGLAMALAQAVDSGSYARSDTELTFTNHDGANDQIDVTAGIAYLDLSGESVDVQSTYGGSSPPTYDTSLPTLPAIMAVVPATVADLDVQAGALSSVWLAYATDGTVTNVSAGDVYLRSDDTGSVTAPPHPNVKLGEANPDDAAADVLQNRYPSPTVETLHRDGGTFITVGAGETIQAAHDALPAFAEGGKIKVTGAYDADAVGESFPITITKPVVIEGEGWGQNQGVVTTNTTSTIFALDLSSNFGRSAIQFKDLRVEGGNVGVDLQDANRAEFRGCLFHNQDTNNMLFSAPEFTGWVLIDHCWMHSAGGVGLRMDSANTDPNATWINNTSVGDAGAQGIRLNGLGTTMYGGSVEGCAADGIRVESATAANTINGVYFEGNASGVSNLNPANGPTAADICITGAYGTQVKNTFHTDAGTPANNAVLDYDANYSYFDGIYGPNAVVNLQFPLEPTVGWVSPQGDIANIGGTRPRVNGLGQASDNAEEPDASNWFVGETVDWTDTGDGTADGIYVLKHNGNWVQLG